MRRKQRTPEPENHERWLVSYADFITLLFAFFVMMYANSKTDQVRAQQISEAFREAMAQGNVTQTFARLVGMKTKQEQKPEPPQPMEVKAAEVTTAEQGMVELLPSLKQLNEMLKKEIDAGRLEVHLERRGLVISLREAAFFPSGNDAIAGGTLPTLETIANELRRTPNPIRLEGHTDSIPISNARFRSNWELSAARGIAMLDLFTSRFAIPAARMAVVGFAETAPIADNSSVEGRARNRRVDIVVLNEMAAMREPRQARPSLN